MYREDGVPAWFAFRYLGENEVDTWRQWTLQYESTFRCCVGTAQERDQAISLLEQSHEGYIVDPLDLVLLVEFGCFDGLMQVCGKLGVTVSAIEVLQQAREQARMRVGPSRGVLALDRDGAPTLLTFSPDAADAWIDLLDKTIEAAKMRCELLPAMPVGPSSADWIAVSGALRQPALDLAYASESSGWPLISSDLGLRQVFHEARKTKSVWLQCALLHARNKGGLSILAYASCVASMSARGYGWISVDAQSVLALLRASQSLPSRELREFLRRGINLRRAEKASALTIARECIDAIWQQYATNEWKTAASLVILNGITDDGSSRAIEAADAFAKRIDHPAMFEALNDWGRMHFLWNESRYVRINN
jgi:hypothetical protein